MAEIISFPLTVLDPASLTAAFLEDADLHMHLLQEAMTALRRNTADHAALRNLHRGFHTLKSTAATMSFDALADLCQSQEALLMPLLEAKEVISSALLTSMQESIEIVGKELAKIRIDKP